MPLSHRNMMLLAVISGVNLAAGIALQFYGVLALGAGPATDTYFAAQTVPMILSAIFSGALINNLTPILASQGTQAGHSLVRVVAGRIAFVLLLVIAILSITANWWVGLLFSGLSDKDAALVVILMPIMCTTFGIAMLTSTAISGLYAQGGFAKVEMIQLAVSVAMLFLVKPVAVRFGVVGFASLLLFRAAIMLVAVGTGFLRGGRVPVVDQSRELWSRMTKIITGSVIFKLGPLVDRSLSSLAGAGMLTSIGLGQQIAASSANITDRVLARPLLATAGARINSNADAGGEILGLYRRQLRIVGWGGGVLMACALAFAIVVAAHQPLIEGLHLHSLGRLDLIALVALSAIPAAASQLSSTLMYAIGKPATISRLALLSFALSTVVKVIGFLVVGVYAVAAGVILYQLLNWLFLHFAAMRALEKSNARPVVA